MLLSYFKDSKEDVDYLFWYSRYVDWICSLWCIYSFTTYLFVSCTLKTVNDVSKKSGRRCMLAAKQKWYKVVVIAVRVLGECSVSAPGVINQGDFGDTVLGSKSCWVAGNHKIEAGSSNKSGRRCKRSDEIQVIYLMYLDLSVTKRCAFWRRRFGSQVLRWNDTRRRVANSLVHTMTGRDAIGGMPRLPVSEVEHREHVSARISNQCLRRRTR